MNCADLEILLCDYVDGTLDSERKPQLEQHLVECSACAELARDVSAAMGFMEKAERVEPPPELMTKILFELPAAHQARARRPGGLRRLVQEWIQPVMQPRFAMGFAMTILSFSLLARFAGINPRQLTLNDLRPGNVWAAADYKLHRAWERTQKFYENIRFVYEIQTQLREWTQGDAAAPQAEQKPQAPSQSETNKPGTSNENVRSGKQEK